MAVLIERDAAELDEIIGERRGRARFTPVVLEADLSDAELARVESHRFALPGVVIDERPRRHYLEGDIAAHLLGQIGQIGVEQLRTEDFAGYRANEVVGKAGLEARLERHLRGRAGGRNVVVDVQGREVDRIDEVHPVKGGRVVLTLDLDLQRAAESAFKNADPEKPDHMGAIVVVDTRNGDVLAMASHPTYDPNSFAGGIDSATWKQLTTDSWRPLRNRAISGQYAPGSTYKAIVAAAGLQAGIIQAGRTEYCSGTYRLGRSTYHCWRRGGHGEVDLAKAMEQSCDVYFYALGVELGIDRLAVTARSFGFGRRTGIGIAGEREGIVPDKEWKRRARGREWIKGETVSAAIGQGYNLQTPLQLALAYAAIANGGDLYAPRIVDRLETWDGRLVEQSVRRAPRRVEVDPAHLAQVRAALTQVVHAERGTGIRARVDGMRVAGKTGTTQVVSLRAVEKFKNPDDIPIKFRDHAWFAAFAPADEPEIAIAVFVEHGRSGGGVAAPIAGKILEAFHAKRTAAVEPDPALELPIESLPRLDASVADASVLEAG
jgi:penicillin-binding protein 2